MKAKVLGKQPNKLQYILSQVDNATTDCFFEFQDMGRPETKNTCPIVLFLSIKSPHQSEYE
ncbi:hypothetical protein Fmac_027128 [Flemingia macrophylla]|uniref:Uncharacterized protein n=1 Tax=Flemingia macrophylla TaxID=520843 RepID=A0ABD1LGV9_9FABA